jgi:hypothetical protein
VCFSWKNVDENEGNEGEVSDNDASGEEDENGSQVRLPRPVPAAADATDGVEWRAERLDREKWKTEALKSSSELIVEENEDSQVTMSSRALQVIRKLSSVDEPSSSSSNENLAPVFKINRRGFLSHTEDDLRRLADLTKSAATPETTANQVSKNSKNFVFSHVSPGQPGPKKRPVSLIHLLIAGTSLLL